MNPGKLTYCLLLLLFVGAGQHVMGQIPASISIEVTPKSVLIGMPAEMKIEVQASQRNSINFPILDPDLTKDVEVLEYGEIDTSSSDGMNVYTRLVQITAWDSGMFMIPPLLFIETDANGKQDSLYSKPIFLAASTVALDTSGAYKDIKAPEEVPYIFAEFKTLIIWGIVLTILAAVGIFFWIRWLNKQKEKPESVPKKPFIPAHIIALKEMEQLRADGLWQKGKYKVYHSRLTEILRGYIGRRMQVNALEMTSGELIGVLKRAGVEDRIPIDKLSQVLSLADLVKFAKQKPLADENERSYKLALDFIEETRPTSTSIDQNPKEDPKG